MILVATTTSEQLRIRTRVITATECLHGNVNWLVYRLADVVSMNNDIMTHPLYGVFAARCSFFELADAVAGL